MVSTKLTMSGEQRGELKRMLNNLPYYTGREGNTLVPSTAAERAARALIVRMDTKRSVAAKKVRARYEDAKAKAREAVFLGDDLNLALRLIKEARAIAK